MALQLVEVSAMRSRRDETYTKVCVKGQHEPSRAISPKPPAKQLKRKPNCCAVYGVK